MHKEWIFSIKVIFPMPAMGQKLAGIEGRIFKRKQFCYDED